ncbi:maltose permease [Histoplasma capsulatum var. duboisii H88]|uniref:Maltose permease n=2 Tax=Ajellomyces capsulatus TaxID=5037 RepID=F0U602_AJEC8|nr:maltose permease [Histoplasma capsulatum H143]EGC41393.1 maltose permease [Histoplasma capsulatum var. duboisii H88]QSS52186.1 maltose permease [Histoplasma capsulatum var. duboisii H88]
MANDEENSSMKTTTLLVTVEGSNSGIDSGIASNNSVNNEISDDENGGIFEVDHADPANLTFLNSLKRFPRVVGYILAACPGILLYGFDMVIVSTLTAMPEFQRDFGEVRRGKAIIPSAWLGVWTGATSIGNVAGAAIAGWVADRFGRRSSLMFGALLSIIGIGICFSSAFAADIDTRRGTFLVGKIIEGFAAGVVICAVQIYTSEIVTRALRGPSQALLPVMVMTGQLIGALVVFACLSRKGSEGYLIAVASQWVFSFLLVGIAIVIPESPPHLIRVGKIDQARESQRRLHRKDVDTVKMVDKLVEILEQERETVKKDGSQVRFIDCFRGTDLRRTIIVLVCHMMPQNFGLGLLANASYFAQTLGIAPVVSVVLLEVGIAVGLIANIIAVWTLSFARRRPLMLWTLGLTGLVWGTMGISGCFDSPVTKWWAAASMVIIIFVCGNGIWPASVLATAETSSLRLRGRTQAIGWAVHGTYACSFAVILPYIYNTDKGNLGAKTGFVFFALSMLSCYIIWFFVPEMGRRSPAELDLLFEHKVPTRDFLKWSAERNGRKADTAPVTVNVVSNERRENESSEHVEIVSK